MRGGCGVEEPLPIFMQLEAGGEAGNDTRVVRHVVRVAAETHRGVQLADGLATCGHECSGGRFHGASSEEISSSDSNYRRT